MTWAYHSPVSREKRSDLHDWRDLDAELQRLTEGPNIPEFVPTYYIHIASQRAKRYLRTHEREKVLEMHHEMTAKRWIFCSICYTSRSQKRPEAK